MFFYRRGRFDDHGQQAMSVWRIRIVGGPDGGPNDHRFDEAEPRLVGRRIASLVVSGFGDDGFAYQWQSSCGAGMETKRTMSAKIRVRRLMAQMRYNWPINS